MLPAVWRALAIAALISPAVLSGSATAVDDESVDPIIYTLSFPELQRQWMRVDVTFPRVSEPLRIRMSRSSPGRYALHDFARNVRDLTASDATGQPLSVSQLTPHEWQVTPGVDRIQVRYRVFGDRLDGTHLAIDATHAHINMPAALVWAEGRDLEPVVVRIQAPANAPWRVATQLFPTADPFVFTAPNFHYAVDSPIEVSSHTRRSFVADRPGDIESASRPTIVLALHHTGTEADADRHVAGLRRIVREQAAIFGEYPAYEQQTYTFIADYLPSAIPDGMEHRNSAILTGREAIATANLRLLALAAHEFFHGWNVERIRPRSLEPFSLLDLNPSGELWLAEGFTSYYEAMTMVRTGLWPLEKALAALGDSVSRVVTFQASVFRSAEEMSRISSLDDRVTASEGPRNIGVLSHYTLGVVLALGFDFELRDRSANARSLDDFMRAMWRRHGRPTSDRVGFVAAPYTVEDVRNCLAEVGGQPLADDLINRFIRGRETMDYRRLLASAGLRLQPTTVGFRIVPAESIGGVLEPREEAFRSAWVTARYGNEKVEQVEKLEEVEK
jgi:predicted metalloprotease with PDZ domain